MDRFHYFWRAVVWVGSMLKEAEEDFLVLPPDGADEGSLFLGGLVSSIIKLEFPHFFEAISSRQTQSNFLV